MSQRFTEKERARRCKKALAALRETGSLRRAGEAAGVSHELVRRWAAAAGITPNQRGWGEKYGEGFRRGAVSIVVTTGEPISRVAASLSIDAATLRRWCHDAGVVPIRARHRQYIRELRRAKLSINAIAERLGLTYCTVWRNLRALGMTGSQRERRHG